MYIYLALCSFIHCHFVGTYIEADDDGVGSGSEHDVAFDNTADTGVDDIDLDFFVGNLEERLLDSFGRTLNIGFYYDIQRFHSAFSLLEEIIKADLRFGAELLFLCRVLTLFDKLSCHALVFDRVEDVAGIRYFGKSGNLDRH